MTPERGATQQQVMVSGEGFRPGEDVTIVAGLDPGDMRVLAHDQADDQGRLTADLTIPEWAERGKPFYFAAEQDGKRAGMASVNVVVPNEPGAINALPPGGEVKTPPLP